MLSTDTGEKGKKVEKVRGAGRRPDGTRTMMMKD